MMLIALMSTDCKRQPRDKLLLSVAYIENASCWPFFVAMERGLFEKLGVSVEALRTKDSTEALNALVSGKVDVSIENSYSVLFAIEARAPGRIRLFLPCSETQSRFVSHLLVAVSSPIQHVEDLREKRIGTYTGATQLLTLKLFVINYLHWDPNEDIQIVQVAPSLQIQALAAGQFDALFTIEPFASAALAKGVARDILPYARGKILDPFPAGASSVRSDVLPQKRKSLALVYDAMVRAAQIIHSDPVSAHKILAKWTGLDEVSAERVGGYEYHTLEYFDASKRLQVQRLADLFYEGDILKKKINTGDMFLQKHELR